MTNAHTVALTPLGLAGVGLGLVGLGALLAGRLVLPAPLAGLLLLALALRLGVMASAIGEAPAAAAPSSAERARPGLLHAAHV